MNRQCICIGHGFLSNIVNCYHIPTDVAYLRLAWSRLKLPSVAREISRSKIRRASSAVSHNSYTTTTTSHLERNLITHHLCLDQNTRKSPGECPPSNSYCWLLPTKTNTAISYPSPSPFWSPALGLAFRPPFVPPSSNSLLWVSWTFCLFISKLGPIPSTFRLHLLSWSSISLHDLRPGIHDRRGAQVPY